MQEIDKIVADPARAADPGGSRQRTYRNPVIDDDFPDPCVIRGRDGSFYAYATQSTNGRDAYNVQVARSDDLVHWHRLGDALPVPPPWAHQHPAIMGPNAISDGEQVILYFAARPKADGGMCIGVAVADHPAGPFKCAAEPVVCGDEFNNIDPFPFEDAGGRRLLYWGSGSIKVRQLCRDWRSFGPDSDRITLIRPGGSPGVGYQELVEAAAVVLRDGVYVLLYSGDNCCHDSPHYAVMAARSGSATGPFELLTPPGSEENLVVHSKGRWRAPGHCTVIRDDAGTDWILYHAIDRRQPEPKSAGLNKHVRRVLLLDRLDWHDGWPRCDGPSDEPRPAPVILRQRG